MSFVEAQMEKDREEASDRGHHYDESEAQELKRLDRREESKFHHTDPRSEPTRPGESYWEWYLRADKRGHP